MTTTTLRPVPNRSWRQFAVAVLSAAVLSYVFYVASWWLFLRGTPHAHIPGVSQRFTWLHLLTVSPLSALAEEFVFRGLILKYLARVHWLLGLLVSSLAFAAIHSWPAHVSSYAKFVHAFLAGLFLGALYLRSRSILVTTAAHWTFNLVSKAAQVLVLGF